MGSRCFSFNEQQGWNISEEFKEKSSKVKTIKHKANKDDMPTTATYNSSVKEVNLSEESAYQDLWLIK